MNTAVRQGMEFDVPPEFAPLVALDPVALEALISLERAFTRQAVSMEMKKSMRKGARIGRPPKELPPEFYETPNDGLPGNSPAGARPRVAACR